MKILALSFSIFCVYFLHSTEAKAAAFFTVAQDSEHCDADPHFDPARTHLYKPQALTEFSHWLAVEYLVASRFHFLPIQIISWSTSTSDKIAGAKEFQIHTGLSPPSLFA